MLVPDSSGTIQYFLNILYWFEERRNTTHNEVYVLSFACAKERTKEKHTGNDPDSYRDSHCRTP